MKLVTYKKNKDLHTGVVSSNEEWIYPITAAGFDDVDMLTVIQKSTANDLQLLESLASEEKETVPGACPYEYDRLAAPIVFPTQDIICLGINYMAHAEESARFKKEKFDGERPHAVYFSKRVNEAVAPYGNIQAHTDMVDSLDYEAELAVIIGKDAKNVSMEDAKDYVFGYTIINDVSARNIQNRHKQWYFGKSLDGFTPMGPCIVTRDDLVYPPAVNIQSYVNGELRQDSNTELLIFGIDHVISELSQGMTLRAGTIISMGTPAGVGMGFDPPKFLQPGDVVECIIAGIGSIVNKVEA